MRAIRGVVLLGTSISLSFAVMTSAVAQKKQTATRSAPDHMMRIGILAPNPQQAPGGAYGKGLYWQWLDAVLACGYTNAQVINVREIQLCGDNFVLMKKSATAPRVYADEPEEPFNKVNVLIIPDTWMHAGVAQLIERFVENGGRVLATRRAGYLDGRFFLTKTLRAGKYNFSLPIFYPYYMENNPNHLREVVKWSLLNGADGISLFEYAATAAKPQVPGWKWFTNFPEDAPNPGIKAVFGQAEKWRRTDMPGIFGTPDFIKELFIHPNHIKNKSPEQLVERAHRLGFNMLRFNPFSAFRQPTNAPLVYPSKIFAPQANSPTPQPDYFDRFYQACKTNGIQVGIYFSGNRINTVGEKGKPVINADGKENRSLGGSYCPLSSPAAVEYQAKILEEFADLYPGVLLYALDEPTMGTGCFCPVCKKLFKERYGRELDEHTNETPEFYEFREFIFAEYYYRPIMARLNRINPYIRMVMDEWAEYEVSSVNVQRLSDEGVVIWAVEFSRRPYYGEDIFAQVEGSEIYLQMEHMNAHRVNWFWFDNLEAAEQNTPLLAAVEGGLAAETKGVKLDVFNGATVHVWLKNRQGNRYPGIVTANAGRTVYYSFDPFLDKLPEKDAGQLIRNALEWLDEHPYC